MLFDLYTCHADGRWYLDGRDGGKTAAHAVASYYGADPRPLAGNCYRLPDGRTVKAIEDAREDAWAGFSGRVREPEAFHVSTPGQRAPVTLETLTDRLGENVKVPADWKETAGDRLAARIALARAGLGTYPASYPAIGATVATVGAPGGYSPARTLRDAAESAIVRAMPAERDDFRGLAAPGGGDWNESQTVDYSARPEGQTIARPLDSLVRQVALARRRRLTRQGR